MRKWRVRLLVISVLCVHYFDSFSQTSPFPTNINNTVVNLPCGTNCSALTFQIPHIKSTADYAVNTTTYSPFPYTSPLGTELTSIYIDDKFSGLIPLPFPFCFYDSIYNNMVVGSNALLTFDETTANQNNAYTLTVGTTPQPVPYAGGVPNSIGTTYYPPASIMAGYQDLYPTINPTGLRKIEYRTEGVAPARKFVVSFNNIALFSTNCNNLICTEQVVLHESTGLIEVFFKDKYYCNEWPGSVGSSQAGLAILGVQNWQRTKAVAAPGKNCTKWESHNQGYRFTPSGPVSRFVSSQILDINGVFIKQADTATTVNGLLDITFPDICPVGNSQQYIIRTTFSACAGNTELVNLDTITVNKTNNLNATETHTNASCGNPDGTITITVPAGVGVPPYQYTLDGGAPQATNVFTGVASGNHTVVVTDAGGCSTSLPVSIALNGALAVNYAVTPTACTGVSNGTITVTPLNGGGPYQYNLNQGPWQTSNVFTGLAPATYFLYVKDASGCSANNIMIPVPPGQPLVATSSSTAATCPGVSNGSITITPQTGIAPYQYSINGGPNQASNVFTGLASGTYFIKVTDAGGCVLNNLQVSVAQGAGLSATVNSTSTSCSGANNGTVTITPTNGTAPFQYSINSGPFQASNTFTGLAAGTYTIRVTDASGCTITNMPATVQPGVPLSATAAKTDVLCNGGASGSITVNIAAGLGTPPYQYSLDGTNYQASNVFNGVAAGTYTVFFKDNNGCDGTTSVTVDQPAVLTETLAADPVICNGQNNGLIKASSAGGVSPYQYSINGTTYQTRDSFNVVAGNYTVYVRDNNGCTTSRPIAVTEPAVLTAMATKTDASCDGGNDGKITVTANGGNGAYQYSLDGTTFQASNIFNVAPGNYTVTIKDAKNCSTTQNITVGLVNNLTLTPAQDEIICEGTSVQLAVTSNANQYSWTPTAGLSNTGIYNPVAAPTTTTIYVATATLGRCSKTDTIIVQVLPAPIPDAGADGYICYGLDYQLQGSGGVIYKWTPSTYLDNPDIAAPLSTPAKTISYDLSVTDANGCASLVTDRVTIDVTPPIVVATKPKDTVVYAGDQFQLFATSVGTDYVWTPSAGLDNPDIPNPMLTVSGDVTMHVTASTIAGCKGEADIFIRVYAGPDIYVPSGFTPNADGKNDVFRPFPVGIKEIKYFRVYNRMGRLMYSTSELNRGWDGKYGGVDQPNGVYVWMAQALTKEGKIITKKGTVALIR